MRTLGTLAAILLSLLLSTATRSATINVISPRRGSTVTTISANDDVQEQTSETLVAHSSVKINNDLLSLKDSGNVVRKQNNARTSLDQQVDQSEIMLIRDLGNIDETLSIMEYEPQKINRKEKRKISAPHKNSDIIEFGSENKEQVPTVISNTYYDPPPTAKPKKNPTSSIYYPNPSQESPIQYSDPRSKLIDPEPVYPMTPRSAKPRTKVRPINSQILSSPEAPKPENVSPPVTYSSSPSDSTKHKHVDQTNSPVQFTKSIRKKKIRKRLREKAVNPENNHNSTDDRPKPRGSKRPGSFSLARAAQGSSLEKPNAENVEPTGGSVNRNRETARNNDQELSSGVPDHRRGSSSRKLHEKHTKSHPIGQRVDVPPTNNEMISSHASYRDSPSEIESVFEESNAGVAGSPSSLQTHDNVRDANVYQNAGTSSSFDSYGSDKGPVRQKVASFQNYKEGEPTTALSSTHGDVRGSKAGISTPSNDYANERNAYRNGGTSSYVNEEPVTTSSSYYEHDSVTLTSLNHEHDPVTLTSSNYEHDPVNPHNLRTYDDVNAPGTSSNQKLASRISRVHQNSKTEMYEEPTVTPSAIFRTIRPPTVTVYPVGPQESASYPSLGYYASSAPTLSTQDSWTPGTKLKRVKEVELDSGSPDVVAEATNLEDEEESKSTRRVDEDERKNDHRENSERVYGNRRNGQDEKYAEKHDDAEAEGTHGDEKHEGSKGGGNGGGKGEFEEGEGAKHEEGHQEIDDEKGEKGYESWHKEEKANKGHHDKEQHSNHYDEEDAKKKEHKEDGEYHEEHQKGEHGEKDAEFDEKGEHKKGHNTKGEHFVHKKDEFEKRTEFFDEFHEDDESEKDGEFHHEHESSKGGHEKKGHLDKVDHEEHYGKKGKHEKGEHYHKEDGHKQAEGKDDHYEHEDMHGQKKGHEEEKKWAYKKGDDGGDDGGDGGKDHKSDR